MDATVYVIFKVQFDFSLEVWFSIVPMADPEGVQWGSLEPPSWPRVLKYPMKMK